MSKYQKLSNNDSTATLTDDENFAIFPTSDDDRRHRHNDDNSHYQVEDLIQYNDTVVRERNANNMNNKNSTRHPTSNNNSAKHMNGIATYRNTTINDSGDSSGSNNLIIAGLDFDDNTMEIPLLQRSTVDADNCINNNNSNHFESYNKKDDLEYGCLCQQKGFASNLSSNSTKTAKSKILWAVGMCCIFMIVEFLGGYIAGSLAIMTDAAHLASDCISFVIGLVAICLGSRPPDAKMSFGYKRLEVMGALASILGIWILTATLVLVAVQRIYANDYDLDANTMMVISGIGILINIIMISILHTSSTELPEGGIGAAHGHSHSHNHGHKHSHNHHHGHSHNTSQIHSPDLQRHQHRHSLDGSHVDLEHSMASAERRDSLFSTVVDSAGATSIEQRPLPLVQNGNGLKHQQDGNEKNLNLRAAMIHAIGDLVQSSGVFIASIFIKIYPKAEILDPLCTILFSIIVIMTTINLFKESIYILLDSVPQGVSLNDLEMDLLNIEGVKSVHHLNIWNHTSNYSILMVHLVIDFLADSNTVLEKATQLASNSKYKIKHSTIQIERVTS
ncbi:zinc transporter ttm-1-like [Musca domestica]|uniref:Zinc transporter ttm-1-like n=1 Tax=Musca domestica TaxID=7370 RepID=A0A1I8NHQ2_MUSDO|nr:zinc transporter ttm-1-like [Musca domestica]XP_058982578.1 zinc transporter ttm-1-like [Musca domestica]XP_058982587.1 zinc transporter ttm-1-like [Musca domestica]XP_058982589.1 zinc transporter ttm-1-like [Musca domestica]XP_058982590.1 zinc transporter ttm-1-like [Musca domestica]XP_058982595.1 zinc transporter ttm-1-like [Musca domestica]XP_058982604.1 zinc transporter ttm-1-like [Musca domestica]